MKSITQVVENLIKSYIDRHDRAVQALTAPVETDATSASKNYTVGKQLILGDILYNVTAPITAGDALVVNTNIEGADDITGQISSLNQTLTNEIDKAYQTDDAAITEVASDDLLPIYDTSATGKKKIAVSSFIGGLVSNPNLLDNPWFTVNQRGQSSYGDKTGTTDSHLYTVDRWIARKGQLDIQADGSVRVYGNLDTGTGNHAQLMQSIDDKEKLIGKQVTFSVKVKAFNIPSTATLNLYFAGSTVNYGLSSHVLRKILPLEAGLHSFTFTVPSDFDEAYMNIAISIGYSSASDVSNAHYIDIEAMKLELGSVSTLAQDTAPNYAEELLKCQRYFVRLNSNNSSLMVGQCVNGSNNANRFVIPLPTVMRATPTLTFSNLSDFKVSKTDLAGGVVPTGIYRVGIQFGLIIAIEFTATGMSTGDSLILYTVNSTGYLDFSADL